LLYRLGEVLDQLGLAGEARNSRIVYLVITSRILTSPISLTIKGESSGGKSFLVLTVLRLFPALVYSQESISHRSVVILERPGMEAADYNIRTLQSEGKIIFDTVERDPATNHQHTVRVEKEGPTNFIFTTTAPQIHQENETRHWSIFIDGSVEQTEAVKGKIADFYRQGSVPVAERELAVWHTAQTLLQTARVAIPYAHWLAEHTPNTPLRMRRDFTRLLALIEAIALLHQYQRAVQEVEGTRSVLAGLADYYIARVLVGDSFGGDAQGRNAKVTEVVEAVSRLYQEKLLNGSAEPSVTAAEIAHQLGKVQSTVRRWLKPALDHGWVVEVNPAGGRKRAEHVPGQPMPDSSPLLLVEELAEAFPELAQGFSVIDPLTGEKLVLEPMEVAEDVF
jgi:DNA-binding transcriptional ArsR family regulator